MSIQTRVFISVLALVGCTRAAPPQPVTPKQAVAALGTVQGTFTEVGDGAYVLVPKSAADGSVLRQISAFGEVVVPTLIECLADTSQSQVEYQGTPTSLGAVCLWTLLGTRYVQDRLQKERGRNPGADGWVSYQAIEPKQQLDARRVWRAWYARQPLE